MSGQPQITPQEERMLIERLRQDPAVVGEVYDRYAEPLYGFLVKRCGHKETAEDLVTKTFIKLLESRGTLEYRGASIGAWLYRVATNALTDHWRSASVRLDEEIDPDSWDPPSDDDPAWNTELVVEGERLREAMKTLSPRDQEILSLRFYGGYEAAEIAETLGISANHASVLAYRALGRLRQKLTASL